MGFSSIRANRKNKGRTLLSTALGASFAVAALGLAATPAVAADKTKSAKPAKGTYSKEFIAVAGPLQTKADLIKAAKAKVDAKDPAGPAELAAASAGVVALMQATEAAAVSPDEKLATGQIGVNLGGYIGDIAMRQRSAKMILDSGKLEPAKVPDFQYYLGNFAYSNKDYATASSALAAAVAAKYPQDDAGELMVDSYARAGQPAQGLALLKQAVAAKRAAGQPVPEGWLKRANVIAYNAKLPAESMDWALTQVELYPSAFNWLGSAQLVRRFGNYGPNETIDLFRLMMRSGAFSNDPKLVGNEYREYIQTADPRRLPGEVIKAIDQGTAAGAISGPFVTESRALAAGRIAADKASLPAAAAKSAASSSGLDALSTGDAYLNYGDAAKAEALYQLALGKSGIDKDRVLTRLGIAQYDQGNYAGARASFKQVGGTRAPLARLWLALVNSKSPAA
jgi:tetratricopeptide (TPR) repeat protein